LRLLVRFALEALALFLGVPLSALGLACFSLRFRLPTFSAHAQLLRAERGMLTNVDIIEMAKTSTIGLALAEKC
jgi:hypothetical protein